MKTEENEILKMRRNAVKWYIILGLTVSTLALVFLIWNSMNGRVSSANQREYTVFMVLNLFYTLLILIFPLNWKLFTVIHLMHGFAAIAFGPNIVFDVCGVLMTIIGIVMAFANGFFRQRMRLKISIHVTLLVLIPIFKTTYTSLEKFHICSLNLFIFWSFFFSYMIMAYYMREFLPKDDKAVVPKDSVLFLMDYNFSDRELFIIEGIIRGEPYKTLAIDLNCSESVVKKISAKIFQNFGVQTRERFVNYISQFEVKYPEEYVAKKIMSPQ